MTATSRSTVIIECPHCRTRYRVPADTLGADGREVACAHCGKTWQAKGQPAQEPEPAPVPAPPADRMFDEAEERELDRAFVAAAGGGPATAIAEEDDDDGGRPISDIRAAMEPAMRGRSAEQPAAPATRPAATRRQRDLARQLPFARLRRAARVMSVAVLLGLVAGGLGLRTEIVRLFPDLAGAYAAIGLGVNVVGLEFRDVSTLMTRRDGVGQLQVDARIVGVANGAIAVPPVLVAILGSDGETLYEWSTGAAAAALRPGEAMPFSTQLSAPPAGAARVRLTFTSGRARAVEAGVESE